MTIVEVRTMKMRNPLHPGEILRELCVAIAINVNCLAGVNPGELESKHVDGKSY